MTCEAELHGSVTRMPSSILSDIGTHKKKLIFLLQGSVIISTGLEVARKELVDVETEHGEYYVST